MTAVITFDLGLSLNKISDINFGNVKAGVAATYHRISLTAGAVSVVSGAGAVFGGRAECRQHHYLRFRDAGG